MKPEKQLSCEVVRADLPLFVGGDLHLDGEHGAAGQVVRQHLAGCPGCAEEFESLKVAREAFLSLGSDSGAPGLWPDVRAVLAAEGRFGVAAAPARVYPLRQLAAAAIVAGLGFFFWIGGDDAPLNPSDSEPAGLVLQGEQAPEPSSLASPLRPPLPDELALSEGAEVFGEDGEAPALATPLPGASGGVSVAGNSRIR